MVFTDPGKSGTANYVGSQLGWCVLGTGSGANTTTRSGLITPAIIRPITGSTDLTQPNEATNTYDYSSVDMSGLTIKEFGATPASGANPITWNVEAFNDNPIVFDGTIEFQVQVTYESL